MVLYNIIEIGNTYWHVVALCDGKCPQIGMKNTEFFCSLKKNMIGHHRPKKFDLK